MVYSSITAKTLELTPPLGLLSTRLNCDSIKASLRRPVIGNCKALGHTFTDNCMSLRHRHSSLVVLIMRWSYSCQCLLYNENAVLYCK